MNAPQVSSLARRHRYAPGLLGLCLTLAQALAAAPAPQPIYVDQVRPLCFHEGGQAKGLLLDLISEMARRNHADYAITPLPLLRIRATLRQDRAAIGTLWRLPELEQQYQWWFKLMDASFVMLARHDTSFDLSSVQAARNLKVGVLLGSPAEIVAQRVGFRHVESSASVEGIARKLLLGRIDIWIASPRVFRSVYQQLHQQVPPLRMSQEIARLDLYLASAPGWTAEQIAPWRDAFDAMKKDQSYAAILAKYPDAVPTE